MAIFGTIRKTFNDNKGYAFGAALLGATMALPTAANSADVQVAAVANQPTVTEVSHGFYNGQVVTNAEAKEATKHFDAVVLYGEDIVGLDSMRRNLAEEDGINIVTLKTTNPQITDCAIVLVDDGKGLDVKAGFNQSEIYRATIDNYLIKRVRSLDPSHFQGDCLDKHLS